MIASKNLTIRRGRHGNRPEPFSLDLATRPGCDSYRSGGDNGIYLIVEGL